MKKLIILSFLFISLISYSQEFTVSKSYILNNEKVWQLQDDDLTHSFLKRVLFFSKKGVGFVFGNDTVSYYDYTEWNIDGSIYTLENIGGTIYKIEFNEKRTKVNYVYVTLDILIKDEVLGEVKRNTQFRFEF